MLKIKEIREQKNLSQIKVAKDLNLSNQTYGRYENGINEPNISILIDIANYFQTSIDNLVGRESEDINLNSYPDYKKNLIKLVISLNQLECERADAFINGMLETKKQYEQYNQRSK